MKQEWSVIRSRVPKDLQTELLHYCEKEKINPSFFIRSLVESRLSSAVPINKAGVNSFIFNRKDDSFSWEIVYDDGERKTVAHSLSPAFLENLSKSIYSTLSARDEYIQKRKTDSVAIHSQIKILKGSGNNVKA